MSDERYERSADMRLLEMQREALGRAPHVIPTARYTDPDVPEADDHDEAPVAGGIVLLAALDARPRAGLIAGALVTVTLSVTNHGGEPAQNVRLSLPLPAATALRPGTFAIDGAIVGDGRARELFTDGLDAGSIPAGGRRTIAFKLVIEAGGTDVLLTPHLRADHGAILGLQALRLRRQVTAPATTAATAERPFYESDDDERAAEPLEPRPLATISVLQPREDPAPPAVPDADGPAPVRKQRTPRSPRKSAATDVPAEPPPTKAPVKSKTAPRRRTSIPVVRDDVTAPEPQPRAAHASEAIGIPGRGGPILTVRIDRARLSTLTRLFSGPSFGMVAHYLVLNALATTDPLAGDLTDTTLAAFVSSQEQLLSRALIAIRLAKTPTAESVGADLPTFPPPLTAHRERVSVPAAPPGRGVVLVRAFTSSEIDFIARMVSGTHVHGFLQAAQLFVGLCAGDAVTGDEPAAKRIRAALTAYAALATAEISRIYLRAKLSRKPQLFRETDAAFDAAAREVLTALEWALA